MFGGIWCVCGCVVVVFDLRWWVDFVCYCWVIFCVDFSFDCFKVCMVGFLVCESVRIVV